MVVQPAPEHSRASPGLFRRAGKSRRVALKERFPRSSGWAERAQRCDAWIATRADVLEQDRFIEDAYPLYAARGDGAYVWDVDGNRYVDYILGYGTVILGHADPRVTGAVIADLASGTNLSPLWRPAQAELTESLVSMIPGAEMAFLMRTGSDATSAALRLARIFTGRDKVLRWGYNGWHDWACPRDAGVTDAVRADTLAFRYNDVGSVRSAFERNPGQIACVLMMPFELEAPEDGFLHEVRALAHEHGALFVLDEMRSGFRVALGGAQEYFGVTADLATYSKAMSNGFCVSAVVGRADVLRGLGRTHMASTFYANSGEMSAALATLEVLRSTDAIEQVWERGRQLQSGLRALVEEHGTAASVVGFPPCPFLVFTAASDGARRRDQATFFGETTRRGVLFHPNHHWFVSSSHTEDDVARTLDACRAAFELCARAR